MNAIRTNVALRTAAVTVVFFAWLVLSNHCALSEMLAGRAASAPSADGGCCHQNSAPRNDDKPCPPMPQGCCKSLKVALPDGAKVLQASSLEVVALPIERLAAFTLALPEECSAAPANGPPPDVPGFVELVLHRSLRSHAPPALA